MLKIYVPSRQGMIGIAAELERLGIKSPAGKGKCGLEVGDNYNLPKTKMPEYRNVAVVRFFVSGSFKSGQYIPSSANV